MTTVASGPFDLDDPPLDGAPANGTAPEQTTKPRKANPVVRPQRTPPLPENGKPPVEPPETVVAAASGAADPEDTNGWPREALQLWPKIIEWLGSKGIGPDEVDISVSRTPMGPFKGESVDLSIIRGKTVAGSSSQSPAEALQQYVVDVLHAAGGDGAKIGAGPALYTLRFFYRRGGGTIKEGKMELASYQELIRARERAAQLDARADVFHEQQAPLPPLGFTRQGQTAPQAAAPPAPPVAPAPTPAPVAQPQVDVQAELARQASHDKQIADLRVELAIARMQAEQTAQMAALRQEFQARMPAPAPVATEEQIAARVTTAVTQALVAAGVLKPDGSAAAPAPAAAPAAGGDSLDDLLGQMERAEKIKKRLRNIVGSDDEDDAPSRPQQIVVEKPKEDDDKKFIGKAIEYVMKNPGMVQTILNGAGSAFEGSPAGEALKKVAAMAGAAQAAQNAAGSVPMPTSQPSPWKSPGA